MRRALLLALLALPLAGAQQPEVGRGERVDVTDARFPDLVVAGRLFTINATVLNRDTVRHSVLLTTTLYQGTSDTPCEGARSQGNVSTFANNVALEPGQQVMVDGAAEHWGHIVNASRVPQDGPTEMCVWVRLGSCPEFTPACFLDFHSVLVPVRLRNTPPTASIEAEPPGGTTQTQFVFRARGEDADGDALTYRWTWGDAKTSEGPTLRTRLGAGRQVVALSVSDGWDSFESSMAVEVRAADGSGPGTNGTPGPALPLLALALAIGALTSGRARASRARRSRARRGARRGP